MRLPAEHPPTWPRPLSAKLLILCLSIIIVGRAPAANFSDGFRWSATATDGSSLEQGAPTTLLWSIVPDGLVVESAASNLVSYLDGFYGAGVGGTDLQLRPWFATLSQQFETIGRKTGLTFRYVEDDGASWSNAASVGSHGDIRLAGKNLPTPGELGRAQLPGLGGDLLLDTANSSFANPSTLGTVFQHEVGHALGLLHVTVPGASVLMNTSTLPIEGPQFDDLYALTRLYGDPYESLGGNDSASAATELGLLSSGATVTVGQHAIDQSVLLSETGFATVDGAADVDVYRVTLNEPGELSVTLAPRGPTYSFFAEGGSPQVLAAGMQSNLRFRVFAADGVTPLASVDLSGLEGEESIAEFDLPEAGDYFIEVRGQEDLNQFYQLDVSMQAASFVPSHWVFTDRFDASDTNPNANIDAPLRQAGGNLDSPYQFSEGLTPAGDSSARLDEGALVLNATQGSPTADSAYAQAIRNFGPQLVGEKWLLSLDVNLMASETSEDAVFALVLGDAYPLGEPLSETAALTVQLATDGDYRVVERGGNASGEANRSGNRAGPQYRVQLLVDETASTPRATVALNGAIVLSNEVIPLDAIERYFALHVQTLTDLPAGGWVEARIDSLNIAVITDALAGDFNLDGMVNIADYTYWRDQLGSRVLSRTMADGSGNGIVDAADYLVWKNNFGATNQIASQNLIVPEPESVLLLAYGLGLLLGGHYTLRSDTWR